MLLSVVAYAATPFSQYGVIQNVQTYSSNPFYNSNTATISTPKIIYATGETLKSSDCEHTVMALIEQVCSDRNNCQHTKLSDIRPSVMVALSTLPGYTYATTCSGYIDSAFDKYVKSNRTYNKVSATEFPTVDTPSTKNTATKKSNLPKWKEEYNERANELRELQSQTKTTSDELSHTGFPTTFNDLSFSEKNSIKKQGYAPYKDAHAYVPLKISDEKAGIISSSQVKDNTYKGFIECLKPYCTPKLRDAEKELYDAQLAYEDKEGWTAYYQAVMDNAEDIFSNYDPKIDFYMYVFNQSECKFYKRSGHLGDSSIDPDETDNKFYPSSDPLEYAETYTDSFLSKEKQYNEIIAACNWLKNPPDETALKNRKDAAEAAYKKALAEDFNSPCICTYGARPEYRLGALQIMGINCKTDKPQEQTGTLPTTL